MISILIFPLIGSILFPPAVEVYIPEPQKVYHRAYPEGLACNCVEYTRQHRPDIPLKNASQFTPATTTPFAGAVAVMRYASGAHHIAYVEAVAEGMVLLRHANVVHCELSTEWRDTNDWRILGYL